MTITSKKVGKYKVYPFYTVDFQHDWMANTAKGYPIKLPHPISQAEVTWDTSERYFQACKYPKHQAWIDAMQSYKGPLSKFPSFAQDKAQELGLPPLDEQWHGTNRQMNGRKHEVMRKVIRAKTTQHSDLIAQLLETEADSVIVEAAPNDKCWGDGSNGDGTNHLGIIWMEERNHRLQEKKQPVIIQNPEEYYKRFQAERKQILGGKALELIPKQSKIYPSPIEHSPTTFQPSANKTAEQRVTKALSDNGFGKANIQFIGHFAGNRVINFVAIVFKQKSDAEKFKNFAKTSIYDNDVMRWGNSEGFAVLVKDNAVFNSLGVGRHGFRNPHSMFDALLYDANQSYNANQTHSSTSYNKL